MDGTAGAQALDLIFDTMTHTYRIWNEQYLSVVALSAVAVFYALAGTNMDLLYNVALIAYWNWDFLGPYACTIIGSLFSLIGCIIITLAALSNLATRRSGEPIWQGPGRPYLIPCKTTHRRLFPKKHSFSYSYLTVGVPVDFKGSTNGMIGVDYSPREICGLGALSPLAKLFSQSWFCIQISDHLQRDNDDLGLRGKLNHFLLSEGLDPTPYPYAYLITAARFAGYNFNPVSLWYLYSTDKTLSAVVLEVNNTFDERRPYLLVRGTSAESSHPSHDQRLQIKGSRVKDFHVSPFNSRTGYYSVQTSDPLGPGMDGVRGIDVTITLNSSKGKPKLIARLFSDGPAVDPASLGPLSQFTFLARWSWVGFATLPRIFWQAAFLLYRLKLNMRNKPEPLTGTLGRKATSVEETLELCFSKYLESLTRRSRSPVSVKYYTSGLLSCTEKIFTSSNCQNPENHNILELRVLTPGFYSRFVQYCNDLDAVTAELNIQKTIWVQRPELLPCVFGEPSVTSRPMGFSDRLFLSLSRRMRQRPLGITLDSTAEDLSSPDCVTVGGEKEGSPAIDVYMLSENKELKRQYQWAVFRQLVADRYFMGRVEPLGWMTSMVRVGIAWVCVKSLTHMTKA